MNKMYFVLGVLLAVALFLLILSMPVHPYKVPRAETVGSDYKCNNTVCVINYDKPDFSYLKNETP
jgi:hypothetical protein